jgi:uroporphyrinogen decarboxylase
MEKMSSRERVETALSFREPDRVPADMTISPDAYVKLCDALGMAFEPYWWDDWNHAFPSVEVLQKLKIDVFHLPLDTTPPGFTLEATEFLDHWGITKKKVLQPDGSSMYILSDCPLKDAETADDILAYPHWPHPEQLINFDGLEELCRQLYRDTDFALTATFGGHIFEQSHYLRSMENFLVDLMLDDGVAEALMTKVCDIHMELDRIMFQKIGRYLTYIRFNGEDVGTQSAPLISVNLFEQRIRAHIEKEWRAAKQEFARVNPFGKICVHSCGSVYDFIPTFIDMGIDMLNPVQPNAKDMDSKKIKSNFGDRLAFHGGVDSQEVLVSGSAAEVREEVYKRISAFAPGGGYIIAPSHNFVSNVPAGNILAMYEAIEEFGYYPIQPS